MSDKTDYTPPKVWQWDESSGGKWASINRPIAGALFWQESSASFLGGGFGHFYRYAPYPMEYPINRYTMEAKRQLDVLDRHLSEHDYICGGEFSIADIAIWPWYGRLVLGEVYDAVEFLDATSYTHVTRWAKTIATRDAVKLGKRINSPGGADDDDAIRERH